MINRLTETTSGNISVAGKNIKDVSPEELRRNIGYVLQHNGLFPHYTIAENIAIVPELLKWPKQKIIKRTSELLGATASSAGLFSTLSTTIKRRSATTGWAGKGPGSRSACATNG